MTRDGWPSAYHALAAEFDAAAERTARSDRRAHRKRLAALGALGVALVGCGAGGAAYALKEGGPARPLPGIPEPDAPVGSVRLGTIVKDPGGALPWTVRAYRAASGRVCIAAGQIMRGRFGTADGDVFRSLPLRSRGVCVTISSDRLATVVDRGRARTVVYGIAGAGVRHVELRTRDRERRLPVGAYGSFITVVAGDTAVDALSVVPRP